MKYILFPVFLVFSFGTLLAQDAPAPAAAAAEPAPAAAEDEARWSDFLPLNKELAGDADLPLPFGIGVTTLPTTMWKLSGAQDDTVPEIIYLFSFRIFTCFFFNQ